jgi:hypothetical protein
LFDLLAVVVQTDPAPIAGWMLLLLAIGMYPVGLLFPGCCACGSSPCSNCTTGTLPDTVTVTFPAWDDEMLGEYRHRISISAPPEWTTPRSRASARVGETTAGAITTVEILDGGAGYALVGRVSPTLTISGGGGAGATFTPTLTSSGTPATWTLASATASGGSGYVDGSSLTITAANGDTTTTQATATVVARGEPTITATAPGGDGASLTVSLSKSGTPPTWAVSGVTVAAGGTGYTHEGKVTFSSLGTTTVAAPAATVATLEQASHTVDASGAGGSGATFSLTYEEETDPEFAGHYYITGVTVTNGGSGYSSGGTVLLKPSDGTKYGVWPDGNPGDIVLGYTLSGDAIASVSGFDNEVYYRDRGIIQSVTVTSGGSVYANTGAAYGVTVTNGGSYYREDKAVAPYVATVTATVENAGTTAPSLTPVVDDDPYSATFGKIESVTINSGGLGHKYRTLYIGKRCCKSIFGGRTFVLRRDPTDPCRYVYQKCEGFGTTGIVLTVPSNTTEYGPQPPYLGTYSGDGAATLCGTSWTSTTLLTDCSDLNLYMESGDRVLSVTPGGTYHGDALPEVCSRCCTAGTLPEEIEVELESIPYQPIPGLTESVFDGWEGTYVLESGGPFNGAPPTSAAWRFYGEIPGQGSPVIEATTADGRSFGVATLSSSGTPAVYTVTGVQITDEFTSGFSVGDAVTFRVSFAGPGTGGGIVNATGTVSSVDANGKILAVTITDGGQYEGHWLSVQVQFQHCGEAAAPPGTRKQDPTTSTTLVGVRNGFLGNNGFRQSIGVITGDFEKPAAPPPPYPEGWECPRENIDTPRADDDYPGTIVYAQDYVSHCGVDCSTKCFLVAQIVRTSGSNANGIVSGWSDSKPYGPPFIHEEEAGRPSKNPINPNANPVTYTDGYLNKVISGYEVFFSYFDIPYCGGAWVWFPPILGSRPGFWSLQNPPVVEIPSVWPGRDLSQATCEACESNLCDLSGKEIVMASPKTYGPDGFPATYTPYGRLTIQ